jgi:molybdopterin converting factor small subunit
MNIRVKINSGVLPYIQNLDELPKTDTWQVPEGTTIQGIFNMLKLPASEAEGQAKIFAMLNNMMTKDWEKALKEGDKVLFAPLVGGG